MNPNDIRATTVCTDTVPHLHWAPPAAVLFSGPVLVLEQHPVALCLDRAIAERLVVLLDRHGLADAPDTPAAACPPSEGAS